MDTQSIRSAIVAEALSWANTPYHHAARVKGAGVDCAQLLIGVFIEGLRLVPDVAPGDYPRDWMLHRDEERFLGALITHTHEVSAPRPGDIALYRVGRCFAHAAIVLDWPEVIHACSHTGFVVRADGAQGWLAGRARRFFSVIE
ncbi:MAG: hydrolase [Betaproteobacteria bacterium]|nr:hydrolase [Betaproteobacteria bacterium]